MSGVEHLPLCDAGRCAAVMAAFAQVKQNAIDNQGRQLAVVLRGVLADFGMNPDEGAVRDSIARHIRELIGPDVGQAA